MNPSGTGVFLVGRFFKLLIQFIYATLPIDAPVPDVLEIIPEFYLETKRIVPINEEDVDYYMFAVDGFTSYSGRKKKERVFHPKKCI